MSRYSVLQRLAPLMATQWGLVTTAQAQQLGVARSVMSRLESAGKLERLCKGVYRNTSAPSERFESLHAAWLSLYPEKTAEKRLQDFRPDAVVCSHTAAWLLGVGDFVPEPYCFGTPVRKQTQRIDIMIRLKDYPAESLTMREGLPVTTFEQTVTDLVAENTDLSLVQNMFLNCSIEMYDNLNRSYLEELLAPYAKRNGFAAGDGEGLLHELTDAVDERIRQGVQSAHQLASQIITPQIRELRQALAKMPYPQQYPDSLLSMIDALDKTQSTALEQGIRKILEAIRPNMLQSFQVLNPGRDFIQPEGHTHSKEQNEALLLFSWVWVRC
ncbi:type IV toxin-antitoxin system AbiEi family antitoxin domain-containing protein [Bifidobacterium amazonense]|uniref:Type IV toxin-antitoxin system AbiEi family antitoxin domain-containing protein n=1 Tax=Bifidobacterium amazonense TaxID=2809027 RepID=A0ABS9VXJ7_9BIFI|nr:type IV toxin-antitoxin system AbiEi family antitoxin domain-containing protein [Bifidobacterium amazonense]MCH9276804.1 type IV toxin-antitoxin system AbiEi family antitoxin domain-containing protein [Bifidobacterium amazonense]